MTLTHGSLFTGIGGFDTAFDREGFETLWQVEIDPYCKAVLAHHWPETKRFDDVTKVMASDLVPVDVITFGSPCQDLSIAGKRAGIDQEGGRSNLFFEACRIIGALRPAIAVWENVPGALSSNRGRDFAAVIDSLVELGALDISWAILDAQWFGVAQRRKRLFVVSDFRAERAGSLLALAEGLRGDPAPSRPPR